ncbi:glycoside hydrolase [Eubacteriaceae bacterium ES2]|nr:glycoside hydrolase [Eubacteriaceae bacterium ES2]
MKSKFKELDKKSVKKIIRSIFQLAFLIVVLITIIRIFLNTNTFQETTEIRDQDNGFIAVSYFGVDQEGTDTLISTDLLDQHLAALYNEGYVTITQEQVINYYQNGASLPEKSLFLIFEDGRRDTAIFAQKILEKYNYKATILTYADKFANDDPKFLTPDDLTELEKSSYWELGTNGYRLEFINVFDQYQNYLGELNTLEFAEISSYIDRDYDHYLMDYIRDENGIPLESYEEMTTRVSADYEAMESVYYESLGSVPDLYILMHSNTGQFGTNKRVSEINKEWIYNMFSINFNREGSAYNDRNSTIYDLTRIQPQAYWSVNHLITRINETNSLELSSITGNAKQGENWLLNLGSLELQGNEAILTTEADGGANATLAADLNLAEFSFSSTLNGNKVGMQGIDLLSENSSSDLSVEIDNNKLIIKEVSDNIETIVYNEDIDVIKNISKQSVDENRQEAEIEELKMQIRYAENTDIALQKTQELQEKLSENTESVAEGSDEYQSQSDIRESQSFNISVSVNNSKLSVYLDDQLVYENDLNTTFSLKSLALKSGWDGNGYSQRNLADNVYDGIFKDIVITDNSGEKETVVFTNKYTGLNYVVQKIFAGWKKVVEMFIKYL